MSFSSMLASAAGAAAGAVAKAVAGGPSLPFETGEEVKSFAGKSCWKLHSGKKEDKATGKSQNIVIKASSGLSDDEVEKMVADAAAHEEEDRKYRELVDARNQADGLIHASEKSLAELGEKASGEERHAVETAISDLKDVLDSDDKEKIVAKTNALAEASAAVAQKLYAEQAASGEGAAAADAAAEPTSGGDDVVDAEFEEVDDDDKKSA